MNGQPANGQPVDAELTEQVTVSASAEAVYAAVADVRAMARYSPECFAVWVWRRGGGDARVGGGDARVGGGDARRFVGWNRRGVFVWFTTCQVVRARPGVEFAFDVTTFGQPVARWGYRLAPVDGGTAVVEYWQDHRNRAALVLGRLFTGTRAGARPQVNRAGMRATLDRLKRELERG